MRSYYRGNENILFNNPSFVTALTKSVRSKLGRNLTKIEKQKVIDFTKNSINSDVFIGREYSVIVEALSDQVAEIISKMSCKSNFENVDIREYQKSLIGTQDSRNFYEDLRGPSLDTQIINTFSSSSQVSVSSLLGLNNFDDIKKHINPTSAKKYVYIHLDTLNRVNISGDSTIFRWNAVSSDNISQGSFNITEDVQNITSIKFYPIRIPYLVDADNSFKRITVLIEEMNAQSFIGLNGRRFHAVFKPVVDDRWINLCPENFNDGIYRFAKPISRLDNITLSFGTPIDRLRFDTDSGVATVTSYGPTTLFTFTSAHNLETGDIVIIRSFTSINPIFDSIVISNVNNSVGNIITYETDNSFSIDVDTSSLFYNGPGTIHINNGSNSVFGINTTFNLLRLNDGIIINGVRYIILDIKTNNALILTTNYADATINAPGITYSIDNRITNLSVPISYAAKRFFIQLELEFLG